MKQQIITFVGPGGTGKTTTAIKVANELAKHYRVALLFDDSFTFPLGNVVHNFDKNKSLGKLLNVNIQSEDAMPFSLIMNEFQTTKKDNLAVCGYALHESYMDYGMYDFKIANTLLDRLLASIDIDIIIVDCVTQARSSNFSLAAIARSDQTFFVLNVGSKGIAYFEDLSKFLYSINTNLEIRTIINSGFKNDPINAMSQKLGNVDYYLPFLPTIHEQTIARNLLDDFTYKKFILGKIPLANKDERNYTKTIQKIVNSISMDAE